MRDEEKIRNHFKSMDDEQLEYFKNQYEFDIEFSESYGYPCDGSHEILKFILEEIEERRNR